MKYLRYAMSKWIKTSIRCPRDSHIIYREEKVNGVLTNNFCCERNGCTWTDYKENISFLLETS